LTERQTLTRVYDERVRAGEIADDAAQRAVVAAMERLEAALAAPARRRFLARRPAAVPRGLYVWGSVGRGKTMLMDAFFATTAAAPKRRIHFNEFMSDVQDRLHAARQRQAAGDGDPVEAVAGEVAGEARLLCLDEVMVTDIADAMILSRLFAELFRCGLTLVATSNSPPEELYKDGLNRGLFLPFVDLLRQHVDVMQLDAATDYRLVKLAGEPVYVTPADAKARAALDAFWRRLTGTAQGQRATLHTHGREIVVPEAADGVARFAFGDLCRKPLSANDYVRIARAYHTVIIDGIPVIGDGELDVARRFILLIDTLYDHHVNLIASAAAEPEALYAGRREYEAFAFPRTVSRLTEMRSEAYLAGPHGVSAKPALAPHHQSG
jgi:cell division protein ZapE